MRVVVVCHRGLNRPLKVFDDDDDGWERAEAWVEDSQFSHRSTNITSIKVH